MKKFLLSLAMLALLASTSFAYVQSGHLLKDQQVPSKAPATDAMHRYGWMGDGGGINQPAGPAPEPIFNPNGEPVTRPIPEPGTMVLASLGLLALGVSRARRRGH